ncbi:MAG TPA: glucose-6-phosphate dehydrogenase assembly protein OpcA [Candidatus Dormibacteraeota bacterium]|nr:glucose-6-phosphate dehydrogenase assembly protein OpcA [Candidatus Dormibacteraeota bacterium]
MAPALSEPVATPTAPAWKGEAVTIAQVLDALTDFRHKFAQALAADDDHPRTRNTVMTLVAITATEADEKRALAECAAIAAHHPSLAIVVRGQSDVTQGRIDASITAPPVPAPDAPAPAHYELVSLHVRGGAAMHLASLVDPLLISGVPTYLWWLGTPPFGSKELRDALQIADALVVDSARFARPYHSFLALSGLSGHAHPRLGLADFQWARLDPWRESIAQFFSPASRRAFLKGITEIGIDYAGEGRGNRIPSAVLIGWIASALGWKLQRAAGGVGGVVSAQYEAERWRVVDVAFRSVAKSGLVEGEISTVRIVGMSGGTTFKLSIARNPERPRRATPDIGPLSFQHLHATGGDDEAGMELAHRTAAQHREMAFQNRESLHHTATGDPPDQSVPPRPTVFVRERRSADSSMVLLTLIDIGQAPTLRHVQRIESNDDASLLVELLALGAHDSVFTRSLAAGADLTRAL